MKKFFIAFDKRVVEIYNCHSRSLKGARNFAVSGEFLIDETCKNEICKAERAR